MKVLFSPPDMTIDEVNEVRDAILSGWITTGPRTKRLEHQIEDYVHADRCVCLNSATAAMEIALHLLGIGPGDEVIVPAYTYTATASVVCHVGAKVVMVDSTPNDWQMDYTKVAAAINPHTKAILSVDLGGVMCDYDKLFAVAESKRDLFIPTNDLQKVLGRVAIISDSAHGFGAQRHGKMSGEVADFTSFSFHAVKNFTTAEGGALTWKNFNGIDTESLYKQCQLLSLHGQNKDALAKTKLGAWEYDIIAPFYKCNMTDIMAALGLVQMKRYLDMLERRKAIIEKYEAVLQAAGICYQTLPHYSQDNCSSGHLFICRLLDKTMQERNEIITKMAERDIACNVHYKPLPMMTAYKVLGFDIKDYPNAYHLFENEVTLPLHTCLTDEMVEYVINNFVELVKG
ncbi:DegT/DnrJ/EryC1/StrS family aminotransferase [Parabacteroides merdae]|jgi:dTDP-4-amino-4,6-dideoxygalactose transaminase|uniref:DegT/DnrJ/EryC1/StrS family aminotransferase n=1 Tax=Parabacteroides merdae TaxID=46503 RepID=A0A3R6HJB4_9BACT|nr:DegT/DnrJ/EryC1/StrS family aminotransferase [Parabacteroides merdae]RGZ43024.1 DegT/DnrJ/EryC1/StrS family aminotransferase [Parabacteroides merdae]RHH74561.1 DegT/DnrJ/EryC1/StrS family aminotransferase [Parabacteroides merdae]